MINIIYKPSDLRYIFLYSSDNQGDRDLKVLEDYLNKIPQYMFLPSYSGIPKPEVFLNKFKSKDKTVYWCHGGLWKTIEDFLHINKIEYESKLDNSFKRTGFSMTLEEFTNYINSN